MRAPDRAAVRGSAASAVSRSAVTATMAVTEPNASPRARDRDHWCSRSVAGEQDVPVVVPVGRLRAPGAVVVDLPGEHAGRALQPRHGQQLGRRSRPGAGRREAVLEPVCPKRVIPTSTSPAPVGVPSQRYSPLHGFAARNSETRCCHRVRAPSSEATPPSTNDETFPIRTCLLPAAKGRRLPHFSITACPFFSRRRCHSAAGIGAPAECGCSGFAKSSPRANLITSSTTCSPIRRSSLPTEPAMCGVRKTLSRS